MSEAEKKWEEFDMTFETTTYAPEASIASREAYKAALRREIEKRIKHFQEMRDSPDTATGSDDWFQYATFIAESKTILSLLDTVEP